MKGVGVVTIPLPDLRRDLVRKWPIQRLAVADISTEIPDSEDALFDAAEHLPIGLPDGFFDLGSITTAGTSSADSISTENTEILQDLNPIRRDITGAERSLTVAFAERSAWTRALARGIPCAEWPSDARDPFQFVDSSAPRDAAYRVLLYSVDGEGAKAFYQVELWPNGQITSKTDRTRSRSAIDETGVTFGFYPDPETGVTAIEAQDGPGYYGADVDGDPVEP